jgi:hypothetical protein
MIVAERPGLAGRCRTGVFTPLTCLCRDLAAFALSGPTLKPVCNLYAAG